MILQALNELYDRLKSDPVYEIADEGFSMQKITFRIVLHPDGRLFEIQDARLQNDQGRLRPRQLLVPGDTKSSGSGLNPGFLWDNQTYLLGYAGLDADTKKAERAQRAFESFRDLHLPLENEINDPAFSAVCRFLEGWAPEQAEDYPILDDLSPGYGIFQILGETEFVHQRASVHSWWMEHHASEKTESGQCLVTAETGPIAKTQKKIKGVDGGQPDMALVSFNASAYESYGKEQSYNAPVLESVSFRYATALNALLDGPMRSKHRRRFSDATVAFWTERPTLLEDVFASIVIPDFTDEGKNAVQDETRLQRIDTFLFALREGRRAYTDLADAPDETAFYLLGLSPNSARIAVRFFLHGTVTELMDNLRQHHQQIRTRRNWDTEPEFPSNSALLSQTARTVTDIPDLLSGALMRSVVLGTAYPVALYTAVLRRIVAERQVNYLKACIIKGYHVRNLNKELPMSLDIKRKEPAYRLGRLFAVLEKTQSDALGTLNAGIRERFYASASATPASVFPKLLRTYQHHLAKLEGGIKINRERLLQEILQPLENFPSHFAMNDQGLFALGYYHQRQELFTKKSETPTEEEEA